MVRKFGAIFFVILLAGVAWWLWGADESEDLTSSFERYLSNAAGRSDITHEIPAYLLPSPKVEARFRPNHVFEGQLPSVHMRFAGLDYLIPKNFVSSSNYYSAPQRDRAGALFRTEYPQFMGMTAENYTRLMRRPPSMAQALQILITVPHIEGKTDMDSLWSQFSGGLPLFYPDVRNFTLVEGPFDLRLVRLTDAQFLAELNQRVAAGLPPQHTKRDIYFVGRTFADGVLVCIAEGERRVPTCKHSFRDSGVVVSVSYKRTLLPQWSRISLCTKRLMERFRGENTDNYPVCPNNSAALK